MGILRRAWDYLRGVKQRASDWFYKSTHVEMLEDLQAKNFNIPEHREIRVEHDPIIHALVTRVANNITARSPIFLDDAGNELEELKEQWEKAYYNNLLNDVIQTTRTHGFCVVEPLAEGVIADRTWLVHDPTDIMMTVFKKFMIEKYVVLPIIEEGDNVAIVEMVSQYDLFPEEVIHFYIGKFKKNREGVAAIKPIWDNAVRYNEILDAMKEMENPKKIHTIHYFKTSLDKGQMWAKPADKPNIEVRPNPEDRDKLEKVINKIVEILSTYTDIGL